MRTYTGEDFERDLDRLTLEWEDAIELTAEWRSFDGEQKAAITGEWLHTNAIQFAVEEYANTHELTESQRAAFLRVRDLIAKYTKALRAMGFPVQPLEDAKGRAVA
ncbi:MAG: hypothetical protein M1343_04500 [Chloroflexi bacterium]|nr:hypothetical protein [Chloroflexota bacterium]MDA8187620.1 hypothetical protein [Dehalococcoidales bacterium]